MPTFTTTNLLESLKKRGMVPDSQVTLEDQDFIRFANEEMQTKIVPLLMSIRENYMLTSVELPLVAGVVEYEIPQRAIGIKAKNVLHVDSNNNLTKLPLIDVDLLPDLDINNSSAVPYAYYVRDTFIHIVPSPTTSEGFLRIDYYLKRGELVPVVNCGQIIQKTATTVTLNALPTAFINGFSVDFVKAQSGYQTLAMDKQIVSVSGSVLTFNASDIPTGLSIGDYVCPAQQSCVVQLPSELHPLLSQAVVVKTLEALGDREGMKVAQAKMDEIEAAAKTLLTQRVEQAPKVVTSWDSIDLYSGNYGGWW